MSQSKLNKSLSKCYTLISGNRSIVATESGVTAAAVETVVEKIEAVQDKIEVPWGAPIAINDSDPVESLASGGTPAHQRPITSVHVESQDSAVGACAHFPEVGATLSVDNVSLASETLKHEVATTLIDPQLLWVKFFSGVVDDAANAVIDNLEEDKSGFNHSLEFRKAKQRGQRRFLYVCNFPVKLILTPLKSHSGVANTFASLLEMQFGPLHSALQVGNVVLEWNDTSLVAPHLCAYEDQVMELDMQPHSQWVKYTGQQRSSIQRAAEEMDFPEQIELLYKVSSEKTRLIHALIEVVIRYNKLYYYNVFSRNCQHFVRDALEALEVDLPSELPGGLGEYYNALIKGKTPSVPSKFKTHADLDKYVMLQERKSAIADMPQHDLEFLLALYFRFHLESKSILREDHKALKQWQCQEKDCCMVKIEKLIEKECMKIYNFTT